MKANLENPVLASTAGQYTGDSSANRGIPHNLGRVPNHVAIALSTAGSAFQIINVAPSEVQLITGGALAVTAMDATNFYVGNAGSYGNSANFNTAVYNWSAV